MIFQMRRSRHREVKQFIQGYTAHRQRSQDWNPDNMTPVPVLFLTTTHTASDARKRESRKSSLGSQAHSFLLY